MSDEFASNSDTQGFLEEQVAELLRANNLDDVIANSRQISVLSEITRHRADVEQGDESARLRLSQALERLAQSVRGSDGRQRLFDEAFVCRRAIDITPLNAKDRLTHLLCLTADGLAADRRAELVMLLRGLPEDAISLPPDIDWGEELLMRVARAFVMMARRSRGWDDIQAAATEIVRLRELQAERESELLPRADQYELSSLVALYNLARMVDLVAEYLVSGSPGDVTIRLDRHHENVSEITELMPDLSLTHLGDLLHVGLRSLVEGSVWTVTRGLGARISLFVSALAAHERANPVLELWPSQRKAMRSSLLDPAKRALVVQMPTSAGKTLIAEFAIVQALALNPESTVAYVVPTRALVNQLTLRLRTDLAPLQMNVEAAVPVFELDPVEDGLLRGGRIHVLVTTPEKLDLLLRQRHQSVADLALTVADEAHNLGDGARGARLELMLGTIKRERPACRFLLLSPFITNASDLASWLGDDADSTVAIDWKPTELVTAAALWVKPRKLPFNLQLTTLPSSHFVELQSEVTIPLGEALPQRSTRSKEGISVSTALRLAERGSVLILCRGRGTSEERAAQVASERDERELSDLGKAVVAYAESELGREHPLPAHLRRGVAYHHAGLSHDLRYLIERLIDTEDINIVSGTTTLAQGVNFPIASVVIETLKKPSEATVWQDLSFAEFWNIAGRAGRALRDRLGLVVYPAVSQDGLGEFRSYLQRDAMALASALIQALEQVDEAADQFNLAFIRRHPTMAIFMQYVAHALAVGGYEHARTEVEDLLRSSLVYHQAQMSDPSVARRLITLTRRYLDQWSEKTPGYLRLADGTGFSLQSVDYLYAQQRGDHREFERADFWQSGSLFASDRVNLTSLIDVIGQIPELTLGRGDVGPFNPGIVAGVILDWINGETVDAIADRWFSSIESNPSKRRRLAGHYLYSTLVGQVPWGIGAVQRLALTNEEDLRSVGHVPSLIFYGVRTREAAAFRMAGVPRIAAEGFGSQWRDSVRSPLGSYDEIRNWLKDRSSIEWSAALPSGSPLDGAACRRVWFELAGIAA